MGFSLFLINLNYADVLLAALSDTLVEHPELLKSASNGLGGLNNKLSTNKTYGEKILH